MGLERAYFTPRFGINHLFYLGIFGQEALPVQLQAIEGGQHHQLAPLPACGMQQAMKLHQFLAQGGQGMVESTCSLSRVEGEAADRKTGMFLASKPAAYSAKPGRVTAASPPVIASSTP
jgi:hypothetical protein